MSLNPPEASQVEDPSIKEKITIEVRTGAPTPDRRDYEVTDKAARENVLLEDGSENQGSEGIFKNGKLYKPGDLISLDEQTAKGFKELGQIRNVKK